MAESFNLLKRVSSFDTSPEMNAYSGVLIFAGVDENGKDITYAAGSMDGNVLQISNEWGTQAQADNIWENIQQSRFAYQPYTARGALLDPSAEIGDGVTISDVYSGIFARATTYGSLIRSDISAPTNEEIEHEFTIQSPTVRQYNRFSRNVRSELTIAASEIAAKVNSESPEGQRSFGWKLTDSRWTLFDQRGDILVADSSGLKVKGQIEATSGKIGGDNGFVITATSIYNNMPSFWSANSNGVYIGTDGIKLGNGFKVDSAGNLEATRGKFGSLDVDGYGNTKGSIGDLSYDGYSTSYGGSLDLCGGSLSSSINVGSQTIGDFVAGKITAQKIYSVLDWTEQGVARDLSASNFTLGGHSVTPSTVYIPNVGRIYYLAWD